MLAVLGAGRVSVGRLGLASAETAVFTPPRQVDRPPARHIHRGQGGGAPPSRLASSVLPHCHPAPPPRRRPIRDTLVPSIVAGVTFVPFQVELSGAPPSKSSRSPPTTSTSDILTASPTTIDYLASAETASDAAVGFLGTAPADHETCHPHMFPGCLSNIEPASFAHESSPGLLSGEYGGDSWPTTPDAFHASMAAPRQPKRSGRSVLEDVDSLSRPADCGHSVAPPLHASFSCDLGAASMDGGGRRVRPRSAAVPGALDAQEQRLGPWRGGFRDRGRRRMRAELAAKRRASADGFRRRRGPFSGVLLALGSAHI
ncbi:hypothetical protein PtA15_1A929 [Puccinia triticina]|uniref:BZIP domain-containing protein n=1 Tax=Puccinia triticina TaxID=208348 RepID=A0ABY7CCE4_9BASI|nr:uncharacterized protein PtA15_1A929 [Puccinia triticina]WAQ81587.1 hypothetical protein PtA15_1A929 [Puccinia triticina]